MPPPKEQTANISLWEIFKIFAIVSTCTLGGGYAMLPVFTEELEKKRGWLTADDMLSALAIAQSCPGLIAVNVAVFIGIRLRGLPGALAAVLGVILTPFWAIILLAGVVAALTANPWCVSALTGVRAGMAALIFLAMVKMGRQTLRGALAWVLALAAWVAMVVFRVNPVWVIAVGALAGLLTGLYHAAFPREN